MRSQFQTALVTAMGCDPSLVGVPGVTVAGSPDRVENHVTAAYLIDSHIFVTCDPAVEQQLIAATAAMEPSLAAWKAVAAGQNGEFLGSGFMHVLGESGLASIAAMEDTYSLRSLDRIEDVALVQRFVETNSEDDLDEAELELDDLDEIIEAVVANGQIVSWASARPFDMAAEYGDIGVITHPEHRGNGLGRAVVASLCGQMTRNDLMPLYRCDSDNTGSLALSRSLGFEQATELCAFRFPTSS